MRETEPSVRNDGNVRWAEERLILLKGRANTHNTNLVFRYNSFDFSEMNCVLYSSITEISNRFRSTQTYYVDLRHQSENEKNKTNLYKGSVFRLK